MRQPQHRTDITRNVLLQRPDESAKTRLLKHPEGQSPRVPLDRGGYHPRHIGIRLRNGRIRPEASDSVITVVSHEHLALVEWEGWHTEHRQRLVGLVEIEPGCSVPDSNRACWILEWERLEHHSVHLTEHGRIAVNSDLASDVPVGSNQYRVLHSVHCGGPHR